VEVADVRKFSFVKTVPRNIRHVQLDLDNLLENALDAMGLLLICPGRAAA
jgi:hypothetical protein